MTTTLRPSSAVSASRPNGSADELARELDAVLAEFDAHVQRLHELATRRGESLRRADTRTLGELIAQENAVVQLVAELEKRRVTVVGALADRLSIPEKNQARAGVVASKVGGVIGERLVARARTLRDRLESLGRLNASLQLAASQLGAHMEGLLRQASQALNHAKTYARNGAVGAGATVVSALDLRS